MKRPVVVGVVVVGVALLGWWISTTTGGSTRTSTDSKSRLAWVAVSDLPPEARTTLRLIDSGGPFPYARDGAVFENREGILPAERRGYYHEYTVVTPSSQDRGARRIVAGSRGERYYSSDHYGSFRRIRL